MKRHILMILLGTVAFAQTARAQMELLNGLVAVVFDKPITMDDIKFRTLPLERSLILEFGRDPAVLNAKIRELRQRTLDSLIDTQLILNEFETKGYNLPESIIDERIRDRILQQFGDRLTMTKTLQAQGITTEAYRKEIRSQVIVDALTALHVGSVSIVSPYEIEQYYQENLDNFQLDDEIRLRMIYIRKLPGDTGQARGLLEEIRQKIIDGTSFAEMASIYHQGSQSSEGGDWIDKEVLREDLAQIAFSLETRELSGVIDLEDGCYLMFVEEAKKAHHKPLVEVRSEIEKDLRAEERRRLTDKWLSQLRENAYIKFYPI